MFDRAKLDRESELFLFDIYVAIMKIKKVAGEFKNVEDLAHDFRSWDSVIREFEIIGEAINHLLKRNIVDIQYRRIVDFRNQITHGYFGIEPAIV